MNPPTRRELLLGALALPAFSHASPSAALAVATRLAERYPVHAPLGYVTALIWSAQRRLNGGRLPARSQQALLSLRQAAPATPPAEWPLRAGYAAFAEAAHHDGHSAARALAVAAVRTAIVDTPEGPRLTGLRAWTDDLFMAALLFDRALPLLPAAEQPRAAEALGRTLLELAARLQRADGLFNHAEGSPVAWGRGNGFASLGLALALVGAVAPASPVGGQLLARLQSHLLALLALQGPDGLWRQVLDHSASCGELTVTAMSLTALSTSRRHGWLPAAAVDTASARASAAVQSRIDVEGGLTDVCASTPAGPTLAFYLQRPIVRGCDDRAAAMALLALTAATQVA